MAKTYFYSQNRESNLPRLIEKNITGNGAFTAKNDGADGYSRVTVNVEGSGGGLNVYYGNTPPELNLEEEGLFVELEEAPEKCVIVSDQSELTFKSFDYDTLPLFDFEEELIAPGKGMGMSGAQIGENIYILAGGYRNATAVYKMTNLAYKYNIVAKSYTRIADYPVETEEVGAISSSGKLYCIGGAFYAANGRKYGSQECYVYDPEVDIYSAIASLPFGKGVYAPSLCEDGKNVYCINGRYYSEDGTNQFYCYNIELNTWTELKASGTLSYGNPAIVIGDKIYCELNAAIVMYDIGLNTWTGLIGVNFSIFKHGSIVKGLLESELIFIGGSSIRNGANHVKIFNIENKTLREFATLKSTRHHHITAVLDDYIYLVGGYDDFSNYNLVKTVEKLKYTYSNTSEEENTVTIRGDASLEGLAVNENIRLNNISVYRGVDEVAVKLNHKIKRKGETEWI